VKIKDYKIICYDSLETVQLTVNNYIENGWVPQGGVSVCEDSKDKYGSHNIGRSFVYAQAMVKYYE